MRRNDYDDFDSRFDRQFAATQRTVRVGVALAFIIQLAWAIGCLVILGGFLWFMGHLAGAW